MRRSTGILEITVPVSSTCSSQSSPPAGATFQKAIVVSGCSPHGSSLCVPATMQRVRSVARRTEARYASSYNATGSRGRRTSDCATWPRRVCKRDVRTRQWLTRLIAELSYGVEGAAEAALQPSGVLVRTETSEDDQTRGHGDSRVELETTNDCTGREKTRGQIRAGPAQTPTDGTQPTYRMPAAIKRQSTSQSRQRLDV